MNLMMLAYCVASVACAVSGVWMLAGEDYPGALVALSASAVSVYGARVAREWDE